MTSVIEAPRILEKREYAIGEIIIDNAEITGRIHDLARQIAGDYEGKDVLLVGIINGAIPTMATLMQELHREGLRSIDIDVMTIESYGTKITSDGEPVLVKGMRKNPSGKHIIIVDDIADSGKTLRFAQNLMENKGAQSVATFALIDKKGRKQVDHTPAYVGFIINDPDLWLQGFGMDSSGVGRGDPDIRRGPYYYQEPPVVV